MIGTIGKTQGVIKASKPAIEASKIKFNKPPLVVFLKLLLTNFILSTEYWGKLYSGLTGFSEIFVKISQYFIFGGKQILLLQAW